MSTKFIPLAEGFWVSPQLTAEDIRAAAAMGVKLIINNRPDCEEAGQPSGAELEAAAIACGLAYAAIPVGPTGIGDAHLDQFDAVLAGAGGPVLAFCRSGTRSTILRALARARSGDPVDDIIHEAAEAGYNLAGAAARLKALAGER